MTNGAKCLPGILVSITLVLILGQVLGAFVLPDQLWGLHFYHFFPTPLGLLAWSLAACAALVLLRPTFIGTRMATAARRAGSIVEAHPTRSTLALALVAALGFGFFRSRQMILGDAWPVVVGLTEGSASHPRQPLAMALHQAVFRGLRATGLGASDPVQTATTAVALVSVVAGVLFVVVAFRLGRVLPWASRREGPAREVMGESGAATLLVTAVLLSQGYVALFFGYIENYSFVTLFLGVCLLTALAFIQGRVPLFVPLAVYLVTLGLHFSTVVLAPSLLTLAVYGIRRRRLAALRDLLLVGVAAALAILMLQAKTGDRSLTSGIQHIFAVATADPVGESARDYMFSWRHVRDFSNEQILIGPFAALLFVPLLILRLVRGSWNFSLVFLAVSGGTYLTASWLTPDLALGYARDWDALALAGVVLAIAGLGIMGSFAADSSRLRLLLFMWIVSLLQLTPWVLVNHSDELSLTRMKLLPLGFGRTETVVANWYRRHGNDGLAIEWFERAIRVNPNNPNPYALLGALHGQRGEGKRAVEMLTRAVDLRPDKVGYRRHLIQALEMSNRPDDAGIHHEWLCRSDPTSLDNWRAWRRTLERFGRDDEARNVALREAQVFLRIYGGPPSEVQQILHIGSLLDYGGRLNAALEYYEQALRLAPDSPGALYGLGSVLVRLDRQAEARPHLHKLLVIRPDHPERAMILRWLEDQE